MRLRLELGAPRRSCSNERGTLNMKRGEGVFRTRREHVAPPVRMACLAKVMLKTSPVYGIPEPPGFDGHAIGHTRFNGVIAALGCVLFSEMPIRCHGSQRGVAIGVRISYRTGADRERCRLYPRLPPGFIRFPRASGDD